MKGSVFAIIPRRFRARGAWVACTIFLRAALNFLGLALLLPVLLLVLDSRSIHATPALERLYLWGGFSSDYAFVMAVSLGAVLLIGLKCVANLWLYRTERNYIYDLYRDLSRRLLLTYRNRGLSFVKNSNSAVLARNVNVVCLTFVGGVLRPLASMASDAVLFLLLFGALAFYDPAASGLVVMIFVPCVWLYYGLVRRRLDRYGELENRAHREKARTVIETFRGYADIEINDAFPMMLRRFDAAMDEVIGVQTRNATIGMLPSVFMEVGLAAGMALLVILSFRAEGPQARLLFGVFAVAALRLLPSVRNLLAGWTSVKYNRYTVDILREASDGQEIPAEEHGRMPLRRELRVEHLSFRYDDDPEGKEVLRDLSFTIRKGERVGIRGASGAGKTTLFNLLLGFYAPTSGSILIDDEPLTHANRRRWQNAVGYVSQSVFLTDSTFAANVALGVPEGEIDRERVARALRTARLGAFIDSLPRGMDTPIGECGCRLSGGQRQRIGIARALYKQADVLFFDEATSSLDSRTEEEIERSIDQLKRDDDQLTIAIIAHRESTLKHCDRIITIGT